MKDLPVESFARCRVCCDCIEVDRRRRILSDCRVGWDNQLVSTHRRLDWKHPLLVVDLAMLRVDCEPQRYRSLLSNHCCRRHQ